MPWLHKMTVEVKNMTNNGRQASESSCINRKEKKV